MLNPPITHFVNNGLQRCVFVPLARLVSDVTNEKNAVVTTTEDHDFNDGQTIRLIVPAAYGMEVDRTGIVTVVSSTIFSVDIDTRDILPFVVPVAIPNTPSAFTEAQVVAVSGLWRNIGAPVPNI